MDPEMDAIPRPVDPRGGARPSGVPVTPGGGAYPPGATYGTGAARTPLLDSQMQDPSGPFHRALLTEGMSPEVAATVLLNALGDSIKAASNNASQLAANGEEVRAQNVMRSVQAMTKLMEQIQAMFLDLKILPFKLASAFARGIGLTTV